MNTRRGSGDCCAALLVNNLSLRPRPVLATMLRCEHSIDAFMDENSSVSNRSAVDVAHFALGAIGFFVGAGGVVINSVCLSLTGVFFVLWSLLYFLVAG
jgi:hypothetical protein